MKTLTYLITFLFIGFILASCNDMNDLDKPRVTPSDVLTARILVLSEGLFNMNNSTMASYSFDTKELNTDLFLSANKRGLGDSANDMKLYGSKVYVVVNVSSQIEILDVHTGISLKRIPLFDEKNVARQPRYVDFYGGKAYICSFDGTVAKIDTATLQVDGYVKCGRNPDGICIANHKIYVANSGGLDFPNYDSTVSVIDIPTFKEIKKITVGLNPSKIQADNEGDVYLISRGDYASIPYRFQKIDSHTDEMVMSFDNIQALNFVISEDKAYIYNYDFNTNSCWIKVFDCKTDKIIKENFITDGTGINTPFSINVNPVNGDVYITDALTYTVWGDVLCFDTNGKLKFRLNSIGLNPNAIVFINSFHQKFSSKVFIKSVHQ